ncbi:radical SAM protein [Rhodospirillum rubrum]|uniref:Radical SAM n=1 Tax=Rhodospirillum rubrum (strain ATCC 11170 / ATH 1.1.1 / DSM 467 / LMG 4362 / NCIMB 8255 / S1) TaxID=269796 RepID=Q2RQQ5_RHORT|nr:radical SAM protein [Rhodospirillum rubrum]ABC23540.1 Radical SAM [Rhodospirillum rubrum ATCC 11170]AEO49279.1 radical SAM family protein [Rhodospirillum rubrum F11]MBK5955214.1 radical SAM protein [Rhodospirillum rubrum]QXG79507.1 radical SAM protein [Rhodospirillum rubrum]HAP98477.1 radical SAM protein [Rhodospirillum rubrum]
MTILSPKAVPAPAASDAYGFGDRLTADFPSQINVDVTEVCNLACVHCPHPQFKKSVHYAGRMLDPALNDKMVEEVRDHGQGRVGYIRYTAAGEPMAHPAIFPMLAKAVARSGTTVSLTTNGMLLDEGRRARLLETGIHLIDISIDAFLPETYARVRVGGDLERVRGGVLRLMEGAARRVDPPKIVVSFVEQPFNQGETADFERFWKENGAAYVVIRRLHSCAGAAQDLAATLRVEQGETRRPCLYPWERIVLNPSGQLSFCPADWAHGAAIAEYRDTTIREVWQGPFYRALREAHLTNSYANHGFCGQCPDWASTRWPKQGRSYADMVQDFKETE